MTSCSNLEVTRPLGNATARWAKKAIGKTTSTSPTVKTTGLALIPTAPVLPARPTRRR